MFPAAPDSKGTRGKGQWTQGTTVLPTPSTPGRLPHPPFPPSAPASSLTPSTLMPAPLHLRPGLPLLLAPPPGPAGPPRISGCRSHAPSQRSRCLLCLRPMFWLSASFSPFPTSWEHSLLQILSSSSFSLVRSLPGSCLINPECSEMMERFDIYAV